MLTKTDSAENRVVKRLDNDRRYLLKIIKLDSDFKLNAEAFSEIIAFEKLKSSVLFRDVYIDNKMLFDEANNIYLCFLTDYSDNNIVNIIKKKEKPYTQGDVPLLFLNILSYKLNMDKM